MKNALMLMAVIFVGTAGYAQQKKALTETEKKAIAYEYFQSHPDEVRQMTNLKSVFTKPEELAVAQTWVNNHATSDITDLIEKKSFLIKLDVLNSYLTRVANTNNLGIQEIKYVHVFLARKDANDATTTTLVLAPVKVNGNTGKHIYDKTNPTVPMVLEHCIPCPICIDGAVNVPENIID